MKKKMRRMAAIPRKIRYETMSETNEIIVFILSFS